MQESHAIHPGGLWNQGDSPHTVITVHTEEVFEMFGSVGCRLCIREQSLCPASSSLANLGKLTALTELDLSRVYCEGGADVDSLMAHLGSLSSLCKLSVASTAICGHGLIVIASLQVCIQSQ